MQNQFSREITLILIKIFSTFSALFVVVYLSFGLYKNWEIQKSMPLMPFVDDGFCNVAIVPISGTIGVGATEMQTDGSGNTFSSIPVTGDVDRVIHDMEYIKKFEGINAVILQIDSYGGVGNAAEVLLSYLRSYPKPVVSVIRDAGTSMGYAVTLSSKYIIAYPGSMVGSIGVNSSYLSTVEKNKREGIEYVSIVSGKYKDLGTPDRQLSKDDLEYLRTENNKANEKFIEMVSTSRNIPIEKIREIADGRVWFADEAKGLGLIDEVGDKQSALAWIEKYWHQSNAMDLTTATQNTLQAIPCEMY